MVNIYEDVAREFIMFLVDEYRFDSIDEVAEYLDDIINRESIDYFSIDSMDDIESRINANKEYARNAYFMHTGTFWRDKLKGNKRYIDNCARIFALENMFWDLGEWINATIKRQKGA